MIQTMAETEMALTETAINLLASFEIKVIITQLDNLDKLITTEVIIRID